MEKEKTINKLPEGWVEDKLNNIAYINMGQSPPSLTYNKNGDGLPFYQGKSEFGKLYPKANIYCAEPIKVVDANDVLISVRAPIGPTNLVKNKSSIGRGLAGIKPFCGMKGEFILYQLRTLEKDLKDKGTGTTFKSISKSILENLPLKIPPLNEQNRIVSKIEELFSELDHAEKGLKKAKHQLEIYMQALLKSAFEGKLTEKWRIENSFEKLKSHHSKDNVLPLGWSYSKIGKIAGFIGSGSTPRGGKNVYQENGIPFIRSQNIQVNCLIQDDLVYISDRVHEKMQRTHTQPKDILLNITGASIGRCAFVPENFEKGNVNQHVCIIRVLPEYVNFNYLTYYLNSPINQLLIKRINSGATREALNLTQIKNITLPMCSIKEQEQIVCELDSKLTLIGNMQESIKIELLNIEKVKHSILNKAFCGKLVHQDSNEETAMALLNRIRIEKNSYLKIVKTNKMNTSANNKNSIKRKDLLEIIKEKFAGTEFSFEQIRKLSDKSYDDLKAELYLLLDKNKELEIIFNKNLKKILFKVKS